MLEAKFRASLALRFEVEQQRIVALALDHERLLRTPVHEFTDAFARSASRGNPQALAC